MSVKKPIPGLSKLYSFYEEIPEEFLDETDVSYFRHKILHISQSQHRRARVSKGSSKKSLAIVVPVLRLEDTVAFHSQRSEYLQKKNHFFAWQFLRLPQKFCIASQNLKIASPKPKIENRSRESKDNLFAHYYKDIFKNPNRHIRSSFRSQNKNSSIFSIKKFEIHGNQFILRKTFNLNHRESHNLYKNRYYVADMYERFQSNSDV